MPATVTNPAATFADVWIPEFIKSVEMFTGTSTARESSPPVEETFREDGLEFWQQQTFRRTGSGRLWVGAPLAKCLAVVASSADDDEGRVALFREVVSQSLQAAAQVLNTSLCPGLQCDAAVGTDDPPPTLPEGQTYWFRAGADLIPVTLRGELVFDALLISESAGPVVMAAPPVAADVPAVFERFVGVDLPVRVVLGRATLRIRDVLKLTVGSLIELNTRPNDPVDVCVHDAVVARGEVVSIRGNYGVRVSDVMSQRDRLTLQLRGRCRPIPSTTRAQPPQLVH